MKELDRQQRKQDSRVITNIKSGNRQLKEFSDNRNIAIMQRKVIETIAASGGYTDAKKIETSTLGTDWFQYKKNDIPGHFEKNSILLGPNKDKTAKAIDPVRNKSVNLSTVKYGVGQALSGRNITIQGASRDLHFSVADKAIGIHSTDRKASCTWHHLTNRYFMDLIDMNVHKAFGHTGGFSNWA